MRSSAFCVSPRVAYCRESLLGHWNPKLCEGRWNHGFFRVCRSGWRPFVRDGLGAVHPIARDALPHAGHVAKKVIEIGADIFPNDLALGRDLKEAPIVAFVDQCIAVWQASRAADEAREKGPARSPGVLAIIFPNDFLFYGIDLQNSRSARHTEGDGRVPAFALIVENEEIAGAGQSIGDHVRVMLAGDLIDRPRHLLLSLRYESGIVRSERPHDLAGLLVDDDDEIGVAEIDQDIIGIEPLVASREQAVRAQYGR